MNHTGGRVAAWAGFVFGSVMSIAANVLYTWIPHPPKGAPEGWTPPEDWAPSIAAQIGSAVWPIGLLIAVEVLSRVPWPGGVMWKVARYGGAGTVALGSALISYGHLNHVLASWGYDALGAAVGPLVLDGLMVVSGFALLAMGSDQPAHHKPRTRRGESTSAAPVTKPPRESKPKPAPEPEPEPTERPQLRAVSGEPRPWSGRAKELMEQGVPRATAYRRAEREHSRGDS